MIVIYPGTFDPLHWGHVDVVRRATALATQVIVGVAEDTGKQHRLTLDQRVAVATAALSSIANVRVIGYQGSTVAFARQMGAQALVRGLRSAADLERELPMATVNRAQGIETIFLGTCPEHGHISSSVVRMALAAGFDVKAMVPDAVRAVLMPTAK